jgi:hypothetical protein
MKYSIRNPRPTPSQERLRELFRYNQRTGKLYWRKNKNPELINREAGTKRKDNYYSVFVEGYKFAVHRIIYKYMTGAEAKVIDHINGNPSDNRWVNLRSVNHQANNMNVGLLKNNKTGVVGVTYREDQDRYIAIVRINQVNHHLGSYKTKAEAVAARKAANILLGFSERHGEAA